MRKLKPVPKPKVNTLEYYCLLDMIAYVEDKYDIDIRDYAKRYPKVEGKGSGFDESKPYQDFWHTLCSVFGFSNGSMIHCVDFVAMAEGEDSPLEEEWEREIAKLFAIEFPGEYSVEVAW